MPVTILLPTAGVIQDFQRSLGDTIGIETLQIYKLAREILLAARSRVFEINDAATRRLLRRILNEMAAEGRLTTFLPVIEKPGFTDITLQWVREMKSQGIFPETYADYAAQQGSARDHQLAELYTRYQSFLQDRDYSDADGLLWVAAEALENQADLYHRPGPLFVLGFDQFTPVQVRILKQLASRFTNFSIYLHWDASRPAASLALARLDQTRRLLVADLELEEKMIDPDEAVQPALCHLHQAIFEPAPERAPPSTGLDLVAAPSREQEVRSALRAVKRLLIDGVSPAEISLAVPNPAEYLPIIRTVSSEYQVPVVFENPLVETPLVSALLNLLALPPEFPWRGVFEALRSPYIQQEWLSREQINLLDQLTRERPVVQGRSQWAFAVQSMPARTIETEDEDLGPPPLASQLPPEDLAAIAAGLEQFFKHLTPPEEASIEEFTWWVQARLLGINPEPGEEDASTDNGPRAASLNMHQACEASPFARRDLQALHLVLQAMRRLHNAAALVDADGPVPWTEYLSELVDQFQALQVPPDPLAAAVRFGPLDAERARTVSHLFVLGLSEGEFPGAPPVDVLYAPAERESHPLPLIQYEIANDASLWWQVVGNTRVSLTLLRPYIDDNGAPWQASPYWDAVRDCFDGLPVEEIPIAVAPTVEEAASRAELLTALANAALVPEELQADWQAVRSAADLLQRRQSSLPAGAFEGVFQDPALQQELASRFQEKHVWSASRLNQIAVCPYGFFAKHVLNIEDRPEPEEGLNPMQRGSLLHAILEDLYEVLAEEQVAPVAANLSQILDLLEASCARIFPAAPQKYGFRPDVLWLHEQAELKRSLKALVSWECEQNGPAARFQPYLQEAGFGIGRSGNPPLDVNHAGFAFRLRGLIDRLDRDKDGNLRVIDYKSGSSLYSKAKMKKGTALQTALYALAAERYWSQVGNRVAESQYWVIPKRKPSGELHFSGPVLEHELAGEIIAQAARSVDQVRAAAFPSAPAEPAEGQTACRKGCEFAALCKVTRESIRKAKRGGLA
jgi:ATP-dependent helicase/DNAse subunit B